MRASIQGHDAANTSTHPCSNYDNKIKLHVFLKYLRHVIINVNRQAWKFIINAGRAVTYSAMAFKLLSWQRQGGEITFQQSGCFQHCDVVSFGDLQGRMSLPLTFDF